MKKSFIFAAFLIFLSPLALLGKTEVSTGNVYVNSDGTVIAPGVAVTKTKVKAGDVTITKNQVKTKITPKKTVVTGKAQKSYIVNDDQQVKTFICNNSDVIINSDQNEITTTGNCKSIVINGDQNKIHWSGKKPQLVNNGDQNTIIKK